MATLNGARVGLFEARMSHELGELVRRLGGIPVFAPAVREIPHTEETQRFVADLASGRYTVVVFLTGVGATAVFRAAENEGRLPVVLQALERATLVCRGPKPTGVLRKHRLEPNVVARKPFTTTEVLAALDDVDLRGQDVAVVHYGERNTALDDGLRARGARVGDVCPYEWAMPENVAPLRAMAERMAAEVDAVAFTSQVQVKHLFALAEQVGAGEQLRTAMEGVVIAAVGPVCADALKQVGFTPDVQPAEPKMGPMLMALADYLELTAHDADGAGDRKPPD